MRIRIVAFHDGTGHSDQYKEVATIEKAVEFYKKHLEKGANTISTRRVD